MSPYSDWLKSPKKWDLVLKAGRVGSNMCCRAKPAWDLIFAGDQPKSSLRSALPLSFTLILCPHTLLLTVLWSCYVLPWLCPCCFLCIECPCLFSWQSQCLPLISHDTAIICLHVHFLQEYRPCSIHCCISSAWHWIVLNNAGWTND